MNRILMAVLATALVACPVLAQVSVDYKLGLDAYDSTYADAWKANPFGPYPVFTHGSETSPQVIPSDGALTVVTWDVLVEVNGTFTDLSVPSGLSNGVFSLWLYDNSTGELYQIGRAPGSFGDGVNPSNGYPVTPTDEGFYSALNDGHVDTGFEIQPDPVENASFACSFAPLIGAGPGRIYDLSGSGGPGLDRSQYPSVSGLPAGNNADLGKLVGMGAGYSEFGAGRVAGVGNIGSCPALQAVAIAEGQIALADGSYTLTIVPGTGNNVLKPDLCASTAGSFAVAADGATGTSIEFQIGDSVSLVSAASVRTHGGAGDFSIAVPVNDANGAIDPRLGSAGKMELTYSGAPADPGCLGLGIVNGVCNSTSVVGNTVVVDMSFADNSCVTVTDNTNDVGAFATVIAHKGNVVVGSGNENVDVSDLGAIKGSLFATLDGTNFVRDVTADGVIDVSDLGTTKGNLFQSVTCP